ncbi:hypothetical protein GCM10011409_20040 [Lentibacillus populi]|uniref:Uncharacterized protein n=1 Tax=Lentibacillus populi TaxID=1827502 RepID=A0A9W5TYD9_9BACI|nr:hypothetical protein [Lentibacillus populi]GGB42458.1 hypothetical protein GCM10011409_20040 [Lentibacillus populi]
MNKVKIDSMEDDVKEVAKLRNISEDMAIVEIVSLYAPEYIKQLKKGE